MFLFRRLSIATIAIITAIVGRQFVMSFSMSISGLLSRLDDFRLFVVSIVYKKPVTRNGILFFFCELGVIQFARTQV